MLKVFSNIVLMNFKEGVLNPGNSKVNEALSHESNRVPGESPPSMKVVEGSFSANCSQDHPFDVACPESVVVDELSQFNVIFKNSLSHVYFVRCWVSL